MKVSFNNINFCSRNQYTRKADDCLRDSKGYKEVKPIALCYKVELIDSTIKKQLLTPGLIFAEGLKEQTKNLKGFLKINWI